MKKWWLLPLILAAGYLVGSLIGRAIAQEHHHGPDTARAHEQFYSTWKQPHYRTDKGERTQSCCHKQDCYDTEFRVENGVVKARVKTPHWEDGRVTWEPTSSWITVPPTILEESQPDPRESPDGLNHVCINNGNLICATRGSGT